MTDLPGDGIPHEWGPLPTPDVDARVCVLCGLVASNAEIASGRTLALHPPCSFDESERSLPGGPDSTNRTGVRPSRVHGSDPGAPLRGACSA